MGAFFRSILIRFHIGSTQECGVVLKLERLFHLLGWSFGLGSPIGLEALSLVILLRAGTYRERATWKRATRYPKSGSGVTASQSINHPK